VRVLVAGGAGYIGSHTAKRLLEAGHVAVVYDDLSRGHREPVEQMGLPLIVADLADRKRLLAALREHAIDTVMHFAAYAYVGESTQDPLLYYDNNVATTVGVLRCMKEAGVARLVFSSSCATYGNPERVPILEDDPQRPVSPYGWSKLMVEQMLRDHLAADPAFSFAALRYFNACGCAMDGSLGEDHDPEPHLIPSLLQAALGLRPELVVFGADYPTPDGTNVRDYIHVDDLADAHIAAMTHLEAGQAMFCNLGTGRGFSVREILAAAERATGKQVPVRFGPRRAGDAVALYADPSRARNLLGWEAKHRDPEAIIASAWRWMQAHPRGYGK
jgi:UDP-glucose-4-epimerase GalE